MSLIHLSTTFLWFKLTAYCVEIYLKIHQSDITLSRFSSESWTRFAVVKIYQDIYKQISEQKNVNYLQTNYATELKISALTIAGHCGSLGIIAGHWVSLRVIGDHWKSMGVIGGSLRVIGGHWGVIGCHCEGHWGGGGGGHWGSFGDQWWSLGVIRESLAVIGGVIGGHCGWGSLVVIGYHWGGGGHCGVIGGGGVRDQWWSLGVIIGCHWGSHWGSLWVIGYHSGSLRGIALPNYFPYYLL